MTTIDRQISLLVRLQGDPLEISFPVAVAHNIFIVVTLAMGFYKLHKQFIRISALESIVCWLAKQLVQHIYKNVSFVSTQNQISCLCVCVIDLIWNSSSFTHKVLTVYLGNPNSPTIIDNVKDFIMLIMERTFPEE